MQPHQSKALVAVLQSLVPGYPVLLLCAGGSVLEKIIRFIPEQALTQNVTITVTDERFTRDKHLHNFSQLMALPVVVAARARGLKVIDTSLLVNDSGPEDLAARFEQELKKWKQENPQGKIVAVVGMGADGHTLGVFPDADEKRFNERFLNPEKWVVGYDAGDVQPTGLRVTTTFVFLEQVDSVILFFEGESKQGIWKIAEEKELRTSSLPVRFINNLPRTQIFSDLL